MTCHTIIVTKLLETAVASYAVDRADFSLTLRCIQCMVKGGEERGRDAIRSYGNVGHRGDKVHGEKAS